MIFHKAGVRLSLRQRIRAYFPDLFSARTREAADIAFSVLVSFMLTSIGAMLLICFCFEMERRSSTPQPVVQQPLPSAANPSVK